MAGSNIYLKLKKKEIDSRPPEKLTPEEEASLASAEEMDDGSLISLEAFKFKSKPLKDWTLGEAQAFCTSRGAPFAKCKECPLKIAGTTCRFAEVWPSEWNLDETPRWTEEEIEDAKALKRLFGDDTIIKRHEESERLILKVKKLIAVNWLKEELFPSLWCGEKASVSEIIQSDGAERDGEMNG